MQVRSILTLLLIATHSKNLINITQRPNKDVIVIDVVFYEAFKEEEAAIKKFLPDSISAQFTDKTIQENEDSGPLAELISIRTQSCIPNHWAKGVKGILTRSHGFDHLLAFRRECEAEIALGYLSDYCARAVAEQAILAMMALLRKLKKQIKNFNTFDREGLTGLECRGRKAFVAGVGCIGSEIVDIARGMRMDVKGFDIDQKLNDLSYVSLEEGLKWADVVFCALPLTKDTKGMFNYQALCKAKQELIFVNVSRGEISPIEDLSKLIDDKILGGISLDVYPQEGVFAHNLRNDQKGTTTLGQIILKLSKWEQALFTPHNAFNTQEALERKASMSADAVIYHIKHGAFPCPVPSA